MKLLIILGLLPLFSALPLTDFDLDTIADTLTSNMLTLSSHPKASETIKKIPLQVKDPSYLLSKIKTQYSTSLIRPIGDFI